jgi:NAD(P)-dependent dehydrogenase (short-subunit alcohol dehydrogenase family)
VTGSLTGKVIWVTGAGKGLGRAIAVAAIDEGATVVATSRSKDDLLGLQAEYSPGQVIVAPGSVTEETDIDHIVSELPTRESGTLHGLVNCAGISPAFVRSEKLDVGAFQQVIATSPASPWAAPVGRRSLAAPRPTCSATTRAT